MNLWMKPYVRLVLLLIIAILAAGGEVLFAGGFHSEIPAASSATQPLSKQMNEPQTPKQKIAAEKPGRKVVSIAEMDGSSTGLKNSERWAVLHGQKNVRLFPDSSKPVILAAGFGMEFPVLAQKNGWLEIRIDRNQKGWLQASGISVITRPAEQQVVDLQTDSVLRSGPDTYFDRVKTLEHESSSFIPLELNGRWLKVEQIENQQIFWTAMSNVKGWRGEELVLPAMSRTSQAAEKFQTNRTLFGKTVVIDPGHGGEDSGAIAGGLPVYERDLNLAAAKVLSRKLSSAGARVIMTRTSDDQTVSLQDRVDVSNKVKADAFVSIHQNIYPENPSVSGSITFYNHAPSKELALDIQHSLTGALTTSENQDHVQNEELFVLRENKQPAVLVEGCFLSNPQEMKDSIFPDYHEQLAAGIFHGLLHYFSNH